MSSYQKLINSGRLESYVLGQLSDAEMSDIEIMAASFTEVAEEIERIEITLEKYAMANAIVPDPSVKAFTMATIDYIERIKKGEKYCIPPVLSENSTIAEFQTWLDDPSLQLDETLDNLFAKIISYTPQALTAILWVRNSTPKELHRDEFESFLILEGSCEVWIEEKIYPLLPGDFISIPLHKNHQVMITSKEPCKAIVQRIAA